MSIVALTGLDDPRLLPYTGLRDPQLRAATDAHRDGLFIAEGEAVIGRALETGHVIVSVLTDPARASTLAGDLPEDVPVLTLPSPLLGELTGFELHRGALACFRRPPPRSVPEVTADASLVVVLEEVNNPTNVGAIARAAAGLGADALLLDDASHDPLYRRALRVAVGETLRLPWARLGPLPDGLRLLNGFTTAALTPSSDAIPIGSFNPERPVALVLGAEGPGLSQETIAACDVRLRIEMHRGVDSLNVAAAAAVAIHSIISGRSDGHPPASL